MRIPVIAVLVVFALTPFRAEAHGTWTDWFVTPPAPNFTEPYLEDARTPHGSQWENDEWTPEAWIEARGNKQAVLKGLENADIIKDADIENDDGVTDLAVGYNFLRLSDEDKIHVVKFVDYVTGTTKKQNGVLEIEYDPDRWLQANKHLGIYTRRGLQLQ